MWTMSLTRLARTLTALCVLGIVVGGEHAAGASELQALLQEIRVPAPNTLEITYSVVGGTYCILERTTQLQGQDFEPIRVQVSNQGINRMVLPAEGADDQCSFYRLRTVDSSHPGDADRDGIDDLTEIRLGFDPLNRVDAYADDDGDGYANLEELRRGWNPREILSPSPVQLSHLPLRGGGIAHRTSGPRLGTAPAGLTATGGPPAEMLPEVAVNKQGTMAYIAQVPDSSGVLHPQIIVSRRLGDGGWAEARIMTEAQSRVTMKLGPGLQINDAGTILVRRYHMRPGLFGWDADDFLGEMGRSSARWSEFWDS